ncbi:PepSY-associated TM helix domain-containing protein [Rheinheimera sp.]|uniref:PepSY-associated TM helix domain-containing protein n=1 Tax=Rheinheimera sp. TaxID=1869214 RepID=UPI00307F6C71
MFKLKQRFWFLLHGWLSLPVWLIFCAVCLTGTIAVFSHELTWLTNPNARAENPQHLPAKAAPELISAVQQKVPDAEVSTVMVMEPYLVNAVLFSSKGMPPGVAYVNQYSGEVQELNYGLNFISFMRALHGWLLFPWQASYSVGYYLVCAMAVVMLGALITGLVIYKNFWRAFTAPKIRLDQGRKTLLTDLHRLAGVWSVWFLLLMSLTGLWYLVQAILWHNGVAFYKEAPMLTQQQLPAAGQQQSRISLEDALQSAQKEFPQLKPAYIGMPEHHRDVYKISGSGDSVFFDQYSWSVYVSPWTGEVLDKYSPEQMTGLQTVMHIADPLHYGTLGGIWTKAIWFLFGLILSGMSITGFMIWGSRTVRAARRSNEAQATTEEVLS